MHPDDIAKQRHVSNSFSRTNKPIQSDAELLGIAGEMAFANLVGIQHTPKKRAPTSGYQFKLGPTARIKITTSRTPGHLFVKEGKVDADVYVLAGVSGDASIENVYFVGWVHAAEVLRHPVTTPSSRGQYLQPAHSIPRDDLFDMKYLMHGLDLNPDHLHRFPLGQNGDFIVSYKPTQRETERQTRPEGAAYAPLPIKKPKP